METVKIKTAQNIEIDYEVANLGERILARLLDGVIFLAAAVVIGFIVYWTRNFFDDNPAAAVILGCIALSIVLFYDLVCEIFFNGQSIGKRVLKIKVISLDGGSPTVGQYMLRWVFRMVDFTLTSQVGALISVAVSDKKQRIGDIIAGTTLIRTEPRTKIKQIAFRPPAEDYEVVFPEAEQLKDQEVALIFEVVKNFRQSDNHSLIYKTASKIQEHLNISDRKNLDDLNFLRTLVKDYNHLQALAHQEER